jgi:hypothetical protein
MVFLNPCAFAVNQVGGLRLSSFRKGILAELCVLWLLFVATQVYLKVKCRTAKDQELLPWNNRVLRVQFMTVFGHNAVALSFTVLHNPFWAALAISWLHLLVFVVYLFLWLRRFARAAKAAFYFMQMIDLWLMLVGISGMRFEVLSQDTGNCLLA